MIYEDRVHKREQFATIHKIAGEGASGWPSLGAGSLLTTAFLRDLARGLEREREAVLLPENVLAYTADLLIWWTPSRLRPMFFSDGAEDRALLNGRIFPHPPLVWKVRRGELSIRALSPQRRPAGETPLMVAPYWNTEPSQDRKSTRLNSSHQIISYAVFCLKKKKIHTADTTRDSHG